MNPIDNNARTRQLMQWIDSHDPRPEPTIDNEDGTLTVSSASVARDGAVSTVRDVIPATLKAARDLLGY